MNRLRNRLILVFLASTLAPLGITLWITTSLIERSLGYAPVSELDQVSRSLEKTGRELYRQARERLRADAESGRLVPQTIPRPDDPGAPEKIRGFWESGEKERFFLSGDRGERLNYAVRDVAGVRVYSLDLSPAGMKEISEQYRTARSVVDSLQRRDLRRGFIYTLVLLSAAVWIAAFALLALLAARISGPIHQLTRGLSTLAGGDLDVRLPGGGNDEVGEALRAFNRTAAELQSSRGRLVYLAQLASWQSLARKMAHEVKNSLTPIRLNVEEIVVRHGESDREFIEQAAQIVVDEVNSLERRVRAFSEFAAEPPLRPTVVDVNAAIGERVEFLRRAHPEVSYQTRLAEGSPEATADEDLLRGILNNLLENAAQAAGAGGRVLASSSRDGMQVIVEVHDSGPGLSPHARETLFEPTISFKRGGMGLGLSIARKGALLSGGDLSPVEGELGGAAFQLRLPATSEACPASG